MDCGPGPVLSDSCFVQCLLKNYCGPTVHDCDKEQILLFGIGTVIFLSVQQIIWNKS